MKHTKNNGFVFLMAILTIPLVGAAMFLMIVGSRTVTADADRAYLNACNRNLIDSALTLLNHAPQNALPQLPDRTIALDIDALQILSAQLTLTFPEPNAPTDPIILKSTCSRHRLQRSLTRLIYPADEPTQP